MHRNRPTSPLTLSPKRTAAYRQSQPEFGLAAFCKYALFEPDCTDLGKTGTLVEHAPIVPVIRESKYSKDGSFRGAAVTQQGKKMDHDDIDDMPPPRPGCARALGRSQTSSQGREGLPRRAVANDGPDGHLRRNARPGPNAVLNPGPVVLRRDEDGKAGRPSSLEHRRNPRGRDRCRSRPFGNGRSPGRPSRSRDGRMRPEGAAGAKHRGGTPPPARSSHT